MYTHNGLCQRVAAAGLRPVATASATDGDQHDRTVMYTHNGCVSG